MTLVKVKRTNFLSALDFAKAGLASREIIQQSTCFVFKDGLIQTYNEKTACRVPSPLGDKFTGAVPAGTLLEFLGKIQEDELEAGEKNGKLLIKAGPYERAKVNMEAKIELKVDAIEQPGEWTKLEKEDEFGEAVHIVQQCAIKKEAESALSCLHIHPDWIEACDLSRACFCRWNIKTQFPESILLRRDSIQSLPNLGASHFSVTHGWVHFLGPRDAVLSCRRYSDVIDFPDLSRNLTIIGEPIRFDKNLASALETAQIFTPKDGEDDDYVRFDAYSKPENGKDAGEMLLTGTGPTGQYERILPDMEYSGRDITFFAPPVLLIDCLKKEGGKFSVTENFLVVQTDKYHYVSGLVQPPDSGQKSD